jgi:hypothetical protein
MKPFVMGLLMGPMMLWMLHGQVAAQSGATWATVAFVAVHAAFVALLIIGGRFAAQMSPMAQRLLARLHRPTFAHLGMMVLGLVLSGAGIHFAAHGVA